MEEEHTRELQVEQAFQDFQKALNLQRQGKLKEAADQYDQLFKLEIISNHYYEEESLIRGVQNGRYSTVVDELSFLSPNIKSLRYHVFRNRAFLYWEMLKSGIYIPLEQPQNEKTGIDPSLKGMFYTMVDDMVISVVYHEPDEHLLSIMYKVFSYLGLKRLLRYSYEYALSGVEESDDIMSTLSINDKMKSMYALLLEHVSGRSAECAQSDLEVNLQFLEPIRADFKTQISKSQTQTTLTIGIKRNSVTWLDVIKRLDEAVKSKSDKEKAQRLTKSRVKYLDSYILTDAQYDRVVFDAESGDEAEEQPAEITLKVEMMSEEPIIENPSQEQTEEPEPETESKEQKDERDDKDQRQIQRSSKRFKQQSSADLEDIELKEEYFEETSHFFSNFSKKISHLTKTDISLLYLGNMVQSFLSSESGYLHEFINALNNWNSKTFVGAFFSNEASKRSLAKEEDDAKIKLLDILEKFGSKDASTVIVPSLNDVETPEVINKLLDEWSEENLHYSSLKEQILRSFFIPISQKNKANDASASCLSSELEWPEKLVHSVKEWVFQSSDLHLEKLQRKGISAHGDLESNFFLSVGYYEFLVDGYSSKRKDMNRLVSLNLKKGGSKVDRSNISQVATELLRTGVKVQKWENYIKETLHSINIGKIDKNQRLYHCICRFKWTMIHFERCKTTNWQDVSVLSEDIEKLCDALTDLPDNFCIPYCNFTNIPELSKDSTQSELTIISVLSMFAKILSAKSGGDTNEAIKIVETILLEKISESDVNKEALLKLRMFLRSSPVDMSLSLWDILFLFYEESGQLESFQRGFEMYSAYVISILESHKYSESDGHKDIALLKVLGSYATSLNKFVTGLEGAEWSLESIPNAPEVMPRFFKLFELFYLFSLHEEASLISSRKTSVSTKSLKTYDTLKDTIVRLESLLIIYLRAYALADDNVASLRDLIALTHDQLGGRRMCGCSDGLFLRLIQDILLGLSSKTFSADVAQVLLCRFHCSLSIDGVTPDDHGTTSTEKFTTITAMTIIKFVLPLCLEKNPISNPMKSDIRSLVDLLYEEIGDPDIDTDLDARRGQEKLEFFLDSTSLTSRFMKGTFHGLMDITFRNLEDKESPKKTVAELGLYFLQANIIFSTYKIRKKSMQIRAVELEHVITLLQNDLIFCPWRAESWFLLGQVYGYFVQDELTWTADKLQSDEKKAGPANIQRKSLLCYFMAVNHCARYAKQSNLKPMLRQLMDSFSKELFNACTSPMSMLAFKVTKHPKFINNGDGGEFVSVENGNSLTKHICLKILQQILHLAIRASPKDWYLMYLLSKVQRKDNKEPLTVIETLLASCDAANRANAGILEPKYKLCSVLYKYVRQKKIELNYAAKCLKEEFQMDVKSEQVTEKDFYDMIMKYLREIISQDKKKWQHKPRYRLARILVDCKNDAIGALEEMSSMISPKSSGKSLVQIWKPDFERPGKHFCYTYQYACFYMEASIKTKNLSNLFYMMPKLKKSTSIMINTVGAWNILCTSVCQLVRERCRISLDFTEKFIMYTIFHKFTEKMKIIIDKVNTNGVPLEVKPYFCLNHDFVELRRLNTGFGPTATIDDTLIAIVIILYSFFDEKFELEKQIKNSETPNNKKMAKKEILPLVTELAKKSSACYDKITKEEPDIYTKFFTHEWPDVYEFNAPYKLDDKNGSTLRPLSPVTHAPKMIDGKMQFGSTKGLIGDRITFLPVPVTLDDVGVTIYDQLKRALTAANPDPKRPKVDVDMVVANQAQPGI